MISRLRTLSLAIPLLLLPVLLPVAGCDWMIPKVSKDILEKELATWLVDHDLEATEITCPDNQQMMNGNKFECHCKVHDIDVPVMVEVIDASEGTVEWEPKYMTLEPGKFSAEVAALPELAGRSVQINCKTVLVSIPDSEWTCDAVDNGAGGQAMLLTLKFTDGEGTYEWQLGPKP